MAAERVITGSTLDYTILRPTMIYGTERDRNMARLIKSLNRYPLIPIAGDGESLQQPIHVDDLSNAIMQVIYSGNCARKAYNVSGKIPLTFNRVINETGAALGKKIYKLHIHTNIVLPIVNFYGQLVKNPKIKAEQILRLNEDKSFDHNEASKDFGFTSRTFSEGINQEVSGMRLLNLI